MSANNSYKKNTKKLSFYNSGAFYDAYESGRILRFKNNLEDLDLDFWQECARKYGPSILEIGCGSGRISSTLSSLGFEVTGIDLSESMLSIAREKYPSVTWLHGNMQDFEIDKKFDMIFIAYNAFLHNLDNQAAIRSLNAIKAALKSNGKLIIEILNPSYEILHDLMTHAERTVCSIFRDPSSQELVVASREIFYQSDSQIITMQEYFNLMESDQEYSEPLNFKLYFPQEMDLILQTTGYEVEHKYGDFQGGKFSSNSKKQIMICYLKEV